MKRLPDISLGRRLGLLQIIVVFAGLAATAVTLRLLEVEAVRRSNLEKQLIVRTRLLELEDRWLAWKLLGLEEALQREITEFEAGMPGVKIRVLTESLRLDPSTVVVPENAEGTQPRIVAHVTPVAARPSTYADHLPIVLVTAGSFLILLLVTFVFARRNVLQPLQAIGESVERFQKSGEFSRPKGRFSGEMAQLVGWLEQVHLRTRELERYESVANLARQVAHDIRSPLSALSLVLSDAKLNPESARLSQLAMERIEGIAAMLSAKHSRNETRRAIAQPSERVVFHACTVIYESVLEKRRELSTAGESGIRYMACTDANGCYVACDETGLRVALSNLLNNAVESGSPLSEISVDVRRQDAHLAIEVADHGRGIPKLALEHWGERGFSIDKPDGTGLGVFQACTFAREAGGTLSARNAATGARVRLVLPCAPPPAYVLEAIRLTPDTRVLIGDDDSSILEMLRTRLDSEAPEVRCQYFDTAEALEEAIEIAPADVPHVILSDLQFGHSAGGARFRGAQVVSLAQSRGFETVLITSYANDILSGRESIPSGCYLLPKTFVKDAPIQVTEGRA
jgi:signal transduction histidine kinase/CheY-like chemotaxis protein